MNRGSEHVLAPGMERLYAVLKLRALHKYGAGKTD